MKKRIAFLLIVPLLCVLAANLNISYMAGPAACFLSAHAHWMVNRSLSGRKPCLTVPQNRRVRRRETSIVYAKYRGLTYTITEIQKPADGHWLPGSIKVYRGSYSSSDNT